MITKTTNLFADPEPDWLGAGFSKKEIGVLRSAWRFRDMPDALTMRSLTWCWHVSSRVVLDILRRANTAFAPRVHFSIRSEEAIDQTYVLCCTENSLPAVRAPLENLGEEPDMISLTDLEEQPL